MHGASTTLLGDLSESHLRVATDGRGGSFVIHALCRPARSDLEIAPGLAAAKKNGGVASAAPLRNGVGSRRRSASQVTVLASARGVTRLRRFTPVHVSATMSSAARSGKPSKNGAGAGGAAAWSPPFMCNPACGHGSERFAAPPLSGMTLGRTDFISGECTRRRSRAFSKCRRRG